MSPAETAQTENRFALNAALWHAPENCRFLVDAAILCAILAALSIVFWHEAAGAVRVWSASPTFNHCFLILPLTLS